jgi:hypothetical protein
MYFTHHFAHHDTLSRARSWLTRLGFDPRPAPTHTSGIPRIAVVVEPHRLGAVNMLISAVERADPDGFPSFWDEARQPHSAPNEPHDGAPTDRGKPRSSVIGWHPLD